MMQPSNIDWTVVIVTIVTTVGSIASAIASGIFAMRSRRLHRDARDYYNSFRPPVSERSRTIADFRPTPLPLPPSWYEDQEIESLQQDWHLTPPPPRDIESWEGEGGAPAKREKSSPSFQGIDEPKTPIEGMGRKKPIKR